MRNIAFVSKYYQIGFNEIMEMPYAVFLSYLKWARIFILEQTEEGQKELRKMEIQSPNNNKNTEPDLGTIRQMTGYKPKK